MILGICHNSWNLAQGTNFNVGKVLKNHLEGLGIPGRMTDWDVTICVTNT